MAFHLYERFQTHCRRCFKVFEEDSIRAACEAVALHEKGCWNKPVPVAQKTLTDGIQESKQ
jgi:hypothetical protein